MPECAARLVLVGVSGDALTLEAHAQLTAAMIRHDFYGCPSSLDEDVELPFIRDEQGRRYFGLGDIESFIKGLSNRMTKASDFLNALEDYKQNDPESQGVHLRLNLAEIVIRQLNANGWTQAELAERIGKKEPFISRIIHSDTNCTFDTAGRILFALGVQAELVEGSDDG